MPPSDLPELSCQPSQSCQRQCPPWYKGDGNQGLALDRKEEPPDFSQEKWVARLNMSEALQLHSELRKKKRGGERLRQKAGQGRARGSHRRVRVQLQEPEAQAASSGSSTPPLTWL